MELDSIPQVLNTRSRIGILAALCNGEKEFRGLQDLLDLSEGNLGNQLSALEEAGFITVSKTICGNRVRRTYSLTATGGDVFCGYVSMLEKHMGFWKGT